MYDKYLIRMRGGKMYLPVAPRVAWFRKEHPDWTIETEPLNIDWEHGVAMFRAVIRDSEGRIIATGTKAESVHSFVDFIEKAETGAIGRALAVAGYGTLQALDLDEGVEQGEVVDAPQTHANGTQGEVVDAPQPTANGTHDLPDREELLEAIRERAEALQMSLRARLRMIRRYNPEAASINDLSDDQLRNLWRQLHEA